MASLKSRAQMVIRLKEIHSHLYTHAPTYMQMKRPVVETDSSPVCTPYATVADNLLSRPVLRTVHKHISIGTHTRPFSNGPTATT